ncbi:hypothetical protein SAMN05518672_103598 [Chitinophaga sp. CF118]|uniref:HNH endonuclease n=1 Tax=Chitinophaga sp. CF118 TaxID=1884367 RepID=UPI0008E6D76F|nr:HNH endonuclease [Chitinophaga sp. CF118]SFD86814.1 hypothetical protein SAMN05518672_103598 [Chitinophaga sp. CF118]
MRPVYRPNPAAPSYFADAAAAAGQSNTGMGQNDNVRRLALCLQMEINRLSGLMIAAATLAAVPGLPVPPALIPAPVPAPIAAVPAINASNQVRNYNAYNRILATLRYNINTDTWAIGAQYMQVSDYPFAMSAMQDVIRQIKLLGATARIYSLAAAPFVFIAIPPLPVGVLRNYTSPQVSVGLNNFFTAMNGSANTGILPYTDAATELVNNLGPYCAYCEANLKAMIHVEHMLPKANHPNTFPAFSKYWENFLPACPTCNSYKSNRPRKIEITQEANAMAFNKDDATPVVVAPSNPISNYDERLTELEYKKLLENYFQFPLEAASYRNIGFRLMEITGPPHAPVFTPVVTPFAVQVGWTIRSIDENEKEVIVNTPGGGPAIRRFNVFWDTVGGAGLLPTPPAALNKVQIMSDICQLNTTYSNTDRRVVERTEAWFMALEAVSRIRGTLGALGLVGLGAAAPATYPMVYRLWRDDVIRTIKEKGFLSVWLKVFSRFAHPLTGSPAPLPTFPPGPMVFGQFLPIIGGDAAGGPAAAIPVRGAAIGNLAQDIAQVILQTGEGVSVAAQNAAGISLGIPAPVPPAVIPMAGAAGVGFLATWGAAAPGAIALAEIAARKAAAAYSLFFPNTNWDQVP